MAVALDALQLPEALADSGRFSVRRCLGSGGFGVVYAAYDKEREADIALKWLRHGDPSVLTRFKREFRSLADLDHPNLVRFRDLFALGDDWFFTMDLLEGKDLLTYLRPEAPIPSSGAALGGPGHSSTQLEPPSTVALAAGARDDEVVPSAMRVRIPAPERSLCLADLGRLRSSLEQLAAGLMAIHAAGMLHRDVKPSNVLVTRDGRVVLLDFGLVTEIGRDGVANTVEERVVGTPAYMSPEQGLGSAVTAASDWYSVGVILYETLTGTLPIGGAGNDLLMRKNLADPTPPQELVRGIPSKLGELCMALLQRDPAQRPQGDVFLERLHAALPFGTPAVTPVSAPPGIEVAPTLVGREPHLWALDEALQEINLGHAVVALVHGLSGMGKSALVRHFIDVVRAQRPDVLVLEGRCYEREAVPYKALDSLVDALARHLLRLPEVAAAQLLPRDLPSLAQLFPVFLQFKAAFATRGKAKGDAAFERRRAFGALRELLQRLADTGPVLLFVDDLQWADADSEPLLTSLLRGPEAPQLLFVGAYRSEDAETSPLVTSLRNLGTGAGAPLVCEVPVRELPLQAVRELAGSLVGHADAGVVDTLARESCGSPLFLRQLAALGARDGTVGLSEAVRQRTRGLPAEAQRLLEVLAVFGKPMELGVAMVAAGIEYDGDAVVRRLQNESLARSRTRNGRSEIEVYHDRIREVIATSLEEHALVACHARIARALSRAGEHDAEALAVHYFAASEHELAYRYAHEAAERASRALAFDRAARMYQMAVELESQRGGEAQPVLVKLAQALSHAGRGKEAAERFLQAADHAEGALSLELKRQAAEQFLLTGHLERGQVVVADILRVMDVYAPKTAWGALLSLVFRRVLLRLRGLAFRPKSVDNIPRDKLVRIDTYLSLARGFGVLDPFRGMDFQTRYLLAALAAGEPVRIAMGLCLEAAYRSSDGFSARSVIKKLLGRAASLATTADHPHARALTTLMRGVTHALLGDFTQGAEQCDEASKELRERCTGVTWEIDNADIFGHYCRLGLGKLNEIRARLPAALGDFRGRGDLYGEVLLRVLVAWFMKLADNDVAGAKQDLEIIMQRWSQDRFLVQHGWRALNVAEVALYEGDAELAYGTMQAAWPDLQRSLLLRAESMRVRATNCRARAALALAAKSKEPRRATLLAEATTAARKLGREKWTLARGYALSLQAALAQAAGRNEECRDTLAKAAQEFERHGAMLYAWSCRARRAQVTADDQALLGALDALRGQGIREPARMLRVFAPGAYEERESVEGPVGP